jgi:ribosomal protein S18 acetylase RimI-like enzyme
MGHRQPIPPQGSRAETAWLASPLVEVAARDASPADVDLLVELYRELEAEQAALRPLWPLADGLDEPVADALAAAIADNETTLLLGTIDGQVFGFLLAGPEPLLVQAGGALVGTIRLIYTQPTARGVGVGAAMMADVMERMRAKGLYLFDARVSPGHRSAKNFFEANGFSARLIIMHHSDRAEERSEESGDGSDE